LTVALIDKHKGEALRQSSVELAGYDAQFQLRLGDRTGSDLRNHRVLCAERNRSRTQQAQNYRNTSQASRLSQRSSDASVVVVLDEIRRGCWHSDAIYFLRISRSEFFNSHRRYHSLTRDELSGEKPKGKARDYQKSKTNVKKIRCICNESSEKRVFTEKYGGQCRTRTCDLLLVRRSGAISADCCGILPMPKMSIIRGGRYNGRPVNVWVKYRDSHPPGDARAFVGFRCAK
jgi:hypothetical protein